MLVPHPFTFDVGDRVQQTLRSCFQREPIVREGVITARRHMGFTGQPWEAQIYPSYTIEFPDGNVTFSPGHNLVKLGRDLGPLFGGVA